MLWPLGLFFDRAGLIGDGNGVGPALLGGGTLDEAAEAVELIILGLGGRADVGGDGGGIGGLALLRGGGGGETERERAGGEEQCDPQGFVVHRLPPFSPSC
jgi:hypothetical protein